MKKIHPWQANDLAGDYEDRGFHPTDWEEVTDFDEEGYGWVCTDDGFGFVNREGYLVIPDEYETINYPFFQNDYCIARKNGKYGIFDRQNNPVVPFIYDNIFADLSSESPRVALCFNGKWKIIDIDGNLILHLNYDDFYSFNEDLIIVGNDDKYGIIDFDQNVIMDFEWDHLEFIGDNFCAGKTVDVFFDREKLELEGVHYSNYFKYFNKDFQKIKFGIIDIHKNILFPFVSDSPVREFNPKNGRARIIKNYWENPDLDDDDLCFVADSEGNKIPFSPSLTKEERSKNFHKRCHELIFGEGTFPY